MTAKTSPPLVRTKTLLQNMFAGRNENPLTGKPISIRAFLKWTWTKSNPSQALDMWNDLHPLVEMSEGGRNTSEKIRARLQMDSAKTMRCRSLC